MNNLENTYVYQEMSNEDIKILKASSVSNINKGIEDLLYLLQLNKLPLADKLVKLVNTGKIRLIYNEQLQHATVKWVYDKGVVLVNVTPHAKRKRGLEESYNIPSNELYSLLIGAAIFYYSDKFNKDRQYIKDCLKGYMEMMGKAITKNTGGHFSGPSETSKFHFLMGYYLLSHNKTSIMDNEAFAANIAGIEDKDLRALKSKYGDFDWNRDYNHFEDLVTNVLREEFKWMAKLQPAAFIHTISQMYGASNTYMIENMDTIGCIMADHIVGGRPSLFSRYPNLRSIFKSSSYNNIITILREI